MMNTYKRTIRISIRIRPEVIRKEETRRPSHSFGPYSGPKLRYLGCYQRRLGSTCQMPFLQQEQVL